MLLMLRSPRSYGVTTRAHCNFNVATSRVSNFLLIIYISTLSFLDFNRILSLVRVKQLHQLFAVSLDPKL